ncbi:MAG: peptidylprolyl isomerase [Clostridia bacterium]|nr:peptidylprolyl isomerase [Clostridia bacterium]
MDKNERDALEAYRQERKARIAKQTKSYAKKSNSHQQAKSVTGKVVGAVIAVAVVVAMLAGILSFFAVPEKLTKAVVIDGKGYSMSEVSCYYMQMFNNVTQTARSYDSNYGEGYGKMLTGYDVSISPADQNTKDEDGNEITWDEYFMNQAIETMASIKRYYNAAVEAGVELTPDAETQIEETLNSYKTYLGNYSLSSFLEMQFGKGVNEKLFRKVLEEQQIVTIYQTQMQDDLKANYSAEDVDKIYAEDKSKYDVVGFRWYTIKVESKTDTAEAESGAEDTSEAEAAKLPEEVEAQKFIDAVKAEANYNEETFKKVVLDFADKDDEAYSEYKQDGATLLQKIDKETIETNVSKDASAWLYETNDEGNYVRQAGDMKYFVNSDKTTVYVIYALGTPFKDETKPADVRHILVKFPETTTEAVSGEDVSAEAEEVTLSAEEKAEYESEANSILDDYNKYIEETMSGVDDEQYFGELASKLSDDTGSQSSGGLIENMLNDGRYVPEFEDWVFAEGNYAGEKRANGTTGIIETEHGYHIMFYVGADENPEWYETILSDLVAEDWEAEQTEFDKQFGEDAIERKGKIEKKIRKECLEKIEMSL